MGERGRACAVQGGGGGGEGQGRAPPAKGRSVDVQGGLEAMGRRWRQWLVERDGHWHQRHRRGERRRRCAGRRQVKLLLLLASVVSLLRRMQVVTAGRWQPCRHARGDRLAADAVAGRRPRVDIGCRRVHSRATARLLPAAEGAEGAAVERHARRRHSCEVLLVLLVIRDRRDRHLADLGAARVPQLRSAWRRLERRRAERRRAERRRAERARVGRGSRSEARGASRQLPRRIAQEHARPGQVLMKEPIRGN